VKPVWIELDFPGKELSKREEILRGESAENPTRNHFARLIACHHPEKRFFLGKDYSMATSAVGISPVFAAAAVV